MRARVIAIVIATMPLTGCATVDLFEEFGLPPDETTGDATYPRLVDTPAPPPRGAFDATAPDPAEGEAVLSALSADAAAQGRDADALNRPVLSDEERARLLGAAR